MNGPLKLLCASAAIFVAALAAEQLFVTPVAPTAWGRDPQPAWQVEMALVFRPVEYVAAGAFILALEWIAIFRKDRTVRAKVRP